MKKRKIYCLLILVFIFTISIICYINNNSEKSFYISFQKSQVNNYLKKQGTSELTTGSKLAELLKRTEITYASLAEIDENRPELREQVREEVEIQVKYDGYIKLQEAQVEKFKKMEKKLLPEDINYEEINGISLEARQKLNKHKPHSIGQASRISGVSPADISVLLVYLQTLSNK